LSDSKVAYVSLQAIGRAIRDLSRPTGTTTSFGPHGTSVEDLYPIGRHAGENWGKPPRLWPEVIAVTEALIGAAFAVAQAHLKTKAPRPPRAADIDAVANYWKHRDEWGPPWGSGPEDPDRWPTVAAIKRLGEKPPVRLGQLEQLAQAVLGRPFFDVDALWSAIS